MRVYGFTFVRNAVKYDYPLQESLRSLLPLVDALYVCLGEGEDDTPQLIAAINDPKIRIIPSVWDDSLRDGGRVLAIETDKAYAAIPDDADWCIYLQADEVLHEADYPTIRAAMTQWKDHTGVQGLLLKYRHFWGSYDWVGSSRRWYRHEVRIVRKLPGLHSYRDAQGFRLNNQPLRVKGIDAHVHHYGWVRNPQALQRKVRDFNKLWHDDQWVDKHIPDVPAFDYSGIDQLTRYTGTHPQAMQPRIAAQNWDFRPPQQWKVSLKDRLLMAFTRLTGVHLFEYRNYKRI